MHRIFIIAATLLTSYATICGAQEKDSTLVSPAELADQLIEYGEQFLGRPYHRGGKGPKSFDCSGFTSFVYKHFGYDISPNSAMQGKDGRSVEGDLTKLQKGDLVLFSGSRNSSSIGHTGIFIGMDPSGESFSFIHAAISGGIRISHLSEEYYRKRFRCARRIIPDIIPDLEAFPAGDDGRENAFVEPDKLSLDAGDMRIVIFGDGIWKVIDGNGQLHAPDSTAATITLGANGRWTMARSSSVMIPTMAKREDRAAAIPETAPDDPQAEYYKVRSGDTLSRIAANNHTTVKALCGLNGITERTILHIGRRLRIR